MNATEYGRATSGDFRLVEMRSLPAPGTLRNHQPGVTPSGKDAGDHSIEGSDHWRKVDQHLMAASELQHTQSEKLCQLHEVAPNVLAHMAAAGTGEPGGVGESAHMCSGR